MREASFFEIALFGLVVVIALACNGSYLVLRDIRELLRVQIRMAHEREKR